MPQKVTYRKASEEELRALRLPQLLTYRETIKEELRALRRLRRKELISGPMFEGDNVCAIGAFAVHAMTREPIPENLRSFYYSRIERRFEATDLAYMQIRQANDGFRDGDNSPEAKRERYNFMVEWCSKKLAEKTSRYAD